MDTITVLSPVRGTTIDYHLVSPNICPICHTAIKPIVVHAARDDIITNLTSAQISILFMCPHCFALFFAKNDYLENGACSLVSFGPKTPSETSFQDEVLKASPAFIEIYHQAEAAEAYNLDQIAGVGYRKALEFLIKDYASKMHPDQAEQIKQTPLAKCINQYIEYQSIKNTATAATWLGNDETHYVRKWTDKDINDLKTFIEACVYWIVMEGRALAASAMIKGEKHSD